MISLIIFVLATIGLTNIMVHGRILDLIGLRPWLKDNLDPAVYELFECYECSGFWSGMFVGLVVMPSGYESIIKWFETSGYYDCSDAAYFFSYCATLLVIIFYKIFFTLICGFAGSMVSQFYSDILYLIRSNTSYEVEENDTIN